MSVDNVVCVLRTKTRDGHEYRVANIHAIGNVLLPEVNESMLFDAFAKSIPVDREDFAMKLAEQIGHDWEAEGIGVEYGIIILELDKSFPEKTCSRDLYEEQEQPLFLIEK